MCTLFFLPFFGVNADRCLTYSGFCDWKHARGKGGTLTNNDSCAKHKDATLSWKQHQSTDTSIAVPGQTEADLEDMSVNVGKFQSLLFLQARHDDVVRERMLSGPKNASWLGHDLQNRLISIIAEWVLKTIILEVKTAR